MKKKLLVLFILFILVFQYLPTFNTRSVYALSQSTRYVSINGVDEGECTSPQSPCKSIQYAIIKSNSGDTILVSEGTYNYQAVPNNSCNVAIVCFINKQLTLKGGYTKLTWNGPDPVNHPSIIDGSGSYRGVAVRGVVGIMNTHLEMTGFIIQNSVAHGSAPNNDYYPHGVGGGMLVQNASVTLKDIIFLNNKAIGANTTSGAGGSADGGGLRIQESPIGTTSILQRVVFENNLSQGGDSPIRGGIAHGALYTYKSNVIIEDSRFDGNIARAGSSPGDGYADGLNADALGGGIAIMWGNVTINNVEVTNNEVYGGNSNNHAGGGYGGGIFIESPNGTIMPAFVKINDSLIAHNLANAGSGATGGNGAGGGIDVDSSNITIERTSIIQNSVIGGNGNIAGIGAGGGIYIFKVRDGDFHANLNNVIIAYNFADQGNIGNGNKGNGGGGGVVIHGVNATIQNSTIAANRIGLNLILGQGLYILPYPGPNDPHYQAKLLLSNSIVANHENKDSAAIIVLKNSELILDHGLFSGNSKDINDDGLPIDNGTIIGLDTFDNISSDIGFVAPEEPYFNYHLKQNSIARDKFDNILSPFDIDKQPRLYGSKVDYGADEYHPFSLSIVPGDTQMLIDWEYSIQTFAGVDLHYEITVSCENGANPPSQLNCNETKNIGDITNYLLTDLTNFKIYTIKINALNLDNQLIASSAETRAFPTFIFVFLPVISK